MKTIVFLLTLMAMSAASAVPITNDLDTGDQLWTINDIAGTETNSIFIELNALALPNTALFGVYGPDDPSTKVQLFDGTGGIPEWAKIEWDQTTNVATLYHSLDAVFYNVVTSYVVDDLVFGFYLEDMGSTFYSEDSLNAFGWDPLTVVASTGDSYGLAWDTTGNGDYNNYVALADDIVPVSVPEPGSLMLMGLGLIGTAAGLRRNRRKMIEQRK